MKKIYIDTENVTSYDCLKKIEISNKDEIILFLTDKSKPLKPEYLNSIHSFGCAIKTYMIKAEKSNALDFYIVSHLGLNYSKEDDFFIISNDKDFDDVLNCYNMFGHNNVNVINEHWEGKSLDDASCDELGLKRILKESKNLSDFHANLVKLYGKNGAPLYRKYKKTCKFAISSKDKCDLHNRLVRAYGNKGKVLYHECKNCLK